MKSPARSARGRISRQRGAALLTAMIIVTLVATLAGAMVWQQWRAVQVEGAERARAQSAWILTGALDWARLILREDGKTPGPDHLVEPWAVPLAESRLSTFLAADKNATDDGPEAFLSGAITDAQSRYNLINLVRANNDKLEADPAQLAALVRLCEAVGASAGAASRIASGMVSAMTAAGKSEPGTPLRPQTAAQLAWLGVGPDDLRALTPYVTLLPVATPVNVNTAPREVLVAAIEGLDLATAERLVQRRQRVAFADTGAVKSEAPNAKLENAKIDVKSSYFEIRGRMRLGDRVLEQISLVRRSANGIEVLRRDRISGLDQPAS